MYLSRVIMINKLSKICILYGGALHYIESKDQWLITMNSSRGGMLNFKLRNKKNVWSVCTNGYDWHSLRAEHLAEHLLYFLEAYNYKSRL